MPGAGAARGPLEGVLDPARLRRGAERGDGGDRDAVPVAEARDHLTDGVHLPVGGAAPGGANRLLRTLERRADRIGRRPEGVDDRRQLRPDRLRVEAHARRERGVEAEAEDARARSD